MKLKKEDRREEMNGIGTTILLSCIVIASIAVIIQCIFNIF